MISVGSWNALSTETAEYAFRSGRGAWSGPARPSLVRGVWIPAHLYDWRMDARRQTEVPVIFPPWTPASADWAPWPQPPRSTIRWWTEGAEEVWVYSDGPTLADLKPGDVRQPAFALHAAGVVVRDAAAFSLCPYLCETIYAGVVRDALGGRAPPQGATLPRGFIVAPRDVRSVLGVRPVSWTPFRDSGTFNGLLHLLAQSGVRRLHLAHGCDSWRGGPSGTGELAGAIGQHYGHRFARLAARSSAEQARQRLAALGVEFVVEDV